MTYEKDNVDVGVAVWIFASEYWEFGCIRPDNTLNVEKLRTYAEIWRVCGVSFLRVIPLLFDEDGKQFAMPKYTGWLPFAFDGKKYDRSQVNPVYLAIVRAAAVILREYGIRMIFELFDSNHLAAKIGPWWDHSKPDDRQSLWYEYGNTERLWVESIVRKLSGLNVVFGTQNEPTDIRYQEYTYDRIFDHLTALGVPRGRIMNGADFHPGEVEGSPAWNRKLWIDKKLGPKHRLEQWSTFHKVDQKIIEYCIKHVHDRRCALSDDGQRPSDECPAGRRNEEENFIFYSAFNKRYPDAKRLNWYIESCDAPYNIKLFSQLLYAPRGIARAFGIELPEPKPKPEEPKPDEPIKPEVPQPEPKPNTEDDMQYTRLFGGWKTVKLFKKIPIPYKEIRFKGWITQLRSSKNLNNASWDAGIVGLLLAWPLWKTVNLVLGLIIKSIAKIF